MASHLSMLWRMCVVFAIVLAAPNSSAYCSRHSDKPLMLLVSFDGFRWDYFNMYNLTNFNRLKNLGSHADYIINSFSTITFPNHWYVTITDISTHAKISTHACVLLFSLLNQTLYLYMHHCQDHCHRPVRGVARHHSE
jgi:hypothetical protein